MADLAPAAVPAALRQRSAAERCLYLAAKLSDGGDGDPLAVALTLEILGGEIKGISDRARYLVAEADSAQGYGVDWVPRALAVLREVSRG